MKDKKVISLSEFRDKKKPKGEVCQWGFIPHCDYCLSPEKPVLDTYKGDSCKLASDFTNICYSLESFTMEELKEECLKVLPAMFPDVPDMEETIKEMIFALYDDTGIISKLESGLFTIK